jgi:PAS domain S-box-containing protein
MLRRAATTEVSDNVGIGGLDDIGLSATEISTLIGATNGAFKSGDFSIGARIIFDAARELLNASAGYVALLATDGSNNEVLFLEAGGRPCMVDPSLPMPVRGLRAQAYQDCKVVYHNSFADSRWMAMLPTGHVTVDNVLFAPLVVDGRSVGLLGLANKEGDFTERDATLAGVLGEMAASVLRYSVASEELRVCEERNRTIVDTAQDAVVTVDGDGKICGWNSSAEKIFRRNADEIAGKALTEIMPQRFRRMHRPAIRKATQSGKAPVNTAPMEVVGLRGDGLEIPIELTLAAWKVGDKQYYTGFIRDISKRKETEAILDAQRNTLEETVQLRTQELNATLSDLRKRESELRKSAAEKTLLLEEMNHRVRNNLTSLLGLLHQELRGLGDERSAGCTGVLRNMETRIRSMAAVQNMMSDAGWSPVMLSDLCERSIQTTLSGQSKLEDIELRVGKSDVLIDSRQAQHLAIVLAELATNTMKYGPDEESEISIGILNKDGRLELWYADNGAGYPEAVLTDLADTVSTGLGLIGGLIRHSLRGELLLDNVEGAVTTISFDLDERTGSLGS